MRSYLHPPPVIVQNMVAPDREDGTNDNRRHAIVFLDHSLSNRQVNLVKQQFMTACSVCDVKTCSTSNAAGDQVEVLVYQSDRVSTENNNDDTPQQPQGHHHDEVIAFYYCQSRGGFIAAWHETAGGVSVIQSARQHLHQRTHKNICHHCSYRYHCSPVSAFFVTGKHMESADVVYAVYCAQIPTLSLAPLGEAASSCLASSSPPPLLFSYSPSEIVLGEGDRSSPREDNGEPGAPHDPHGITVSHEDEVMRLIQSFFVGEHQRGAVDGEKRKATGKFIVVDGADGAGKETQTECLRRRLLRETKLENENWNPHGGSRSPQNSTTSINTGTNPEHRQNEEHVENGKTEDSVEERGGWSSQKVGRVAFPHYGGYCGNVVRDVLKERKAPKHLLNTLSLSLMFTLNRLSKRAELLWARYQGKYVLLDRYYTANFGYQGWKVKDEEREGFVRYLERIEVEWLGLPRPDMVIYLDLPPQTALMAMQRDTKRRELDSNETASMDEKERIRQVFCWCCEVLDNWRQVVSGKEDSGERYSVREVHEKLWHHVGDMLLSVDSGVEKEKKHE